VERLIIAGLAGRAHAPQAVVRVVQNDSRAVTILGEAIQNGENTPKARQNLAYAYALGGRLREARMIAAQDVPADQIETRISDWALQASIGSQRSRVAAMLGVPMRADPGQPAKLALAAPAAAPMMARAIPEPKRTEEELPAIAGAAPPMAPVFAQAEPQTAPEPVMPREPETALASVPAPIIEAPRQASAVRFVSNPVVQDISRYTETRTQTAPARRPAPVRTAAVAPPSQPAPAPVARAKSAAPATHVVQLGSFLSEATAHRAWDIYVGRDPSLRDREMRITEAVVNGRRYWRVAAAGYAADGARDMCSAVRSRGRDCLAYAERQPRPAAPTRVAPERFARR
jgi:hypothetical protein